MFLLSVHHHPGCFPEALAVKVSLFARERKNFPAQARSGLCAIYNLKCHIGWSKKLLGYLWIGTKLFGSKLIKTCELGLTKKNSNFAGVVITGTLLEEWIRDAQKGDIDSYQKIYSTFAQRVLNYIYRMTNSQEEAEDLTQETFVAVYRNLKNLKDNSKFEAWLFRIARNFVYQRYRNHQPANVSVESINEDGRPEIQLADVRKNPDEAFLSEELEKVVESVIADLPPKYREVFVLSALQGFSYQKIAEIMGHSLASVKTDIHRARLQVRKRVKEYLKVG